MRYTLRLSRNLSRFHHGFASSCTQMYTPGCHCEPEGRGNHRSKTSRFLEILCVYFRILTLIGLMIIGSVCAVGEGLPYRVLDVDKVISQSLAYTEFKSRLDKANQKYQKEIEFYESQLVELDKKIKTAQVKKDELVKNKQTIVLYESKVQELMQKRKEINERASDKAFGIMRENIEKLVYEYAKKNNLSIIFSRMQVMYFSNTVDITDQIIQDLNKTLLKIDVVI